MYPTYLAPPNMSLYFSEEDFQVLSKLRIIKKNLIHFQGFPDYFYNEDLLRKKEYFGQYGKIEKIVLVAKSDESTGKKSNSAYITFSSEEEAAYAVLSVDSIIIDGKITRVFFGTTKYCVHFLSNQVCINKNKCMYLHYLADRDDILGANSKFGYSEHLRLAKKIINFDSKKTINFINSLNVDFQTVLPNIKSIYLRDDLQEINSISENLFEKKNNDELLGLLHYNNLDSVNNNKINNIKYKDNINNNSCSITNLDDNSTESCNESSEDNNCNSNNKPFYFFKDFLQDKVLESKSSKNINKEFNVNAYKKIVDLIMKRKPYFLGINNGNNLKYIELYFCLSHCKNDQIINLFKEIKDCF